MSYTRFTVTITTGGHMFSPAPSTREVERVIKDALMACAKPRYEETDPWDVFIKVEAKSERFDPWADTKVPEEWVRDELPF